MAELKKSVKSELHENCGKGDPAFTASPGAGPSRIGWNTRRRREQLPVAPCAGYIKMPVEKGDCPLPKGDLSAANRYCREGLSPFSTGCQGPSPVRKEPIMPADAP